MFNFKLLIDVPYGDERQSRFRSHLSTARWPTNGFVLPYDAALRVSAPLIEASRCLDSHQVCVESDSRMVFVDVDFYHFRSIFK